MLAKHSTVTTYDLSSLRITNSSGAPLARGLVVAVYKRTGVKINKATAFLKRVQVSVISGGTTGYLE